MNDMEIWKPVPGFEGLYDVSDHGRVRSLRDSHQQRRELVLSPGNVDGYRMVALMAGKRHQLRVHRLVLLAFVGPPTNEQKHTRHLNGDRADNRLCNLAWGTPKENGADLTKHGTIRGAKNPKARLTEYQVIEIRRRYASGCGKGMKALADEYGVHKTCICFLLTRRSWTHLP
jgi:hypothetical protein